MTELTRIAAALQRKSEAQPSLAMQVELAARIVAPLWPLESAIAVNPLSGLEHMPFEEAVRAGSELFGASSGLDLDLWRRLSAAGKPSKNAVRSAAIMELGGLNDAFVMVGPDISLLDCLIARLFDLPAEPKPERAADPAGREVADYCAAYFANDVAALAIGRGDSGLYMASLPLMRTTHRKTDWAGVPETPMAAIGWALDRLGVVSEDRPLHLTKTVARLPGWAGHIRWRDEHADEDRRQERPAHMADLIALILLADLAHGRGKTLSRSVAQPELRQRLAAQFGIGADDFAPEVRRVLKLDEADLALIFQRAAETEYAFQLGRAVERNSRTAITHSAKADAQLMFCIDVRSEPMRRAIEKEGRYETIGYAGFFGLPVAMREPGRARTRRLPVLIGPQHELLLRPSPGAEAEAKSFLLKRRRGESLQGVFAHLKSGTATSFATAEAVGPLAAAMMVLQTFAPRAAAALKARFTGDRHALAPSIDSHDRHDGLSGAERLAYARSLFALTGMKIRSRLVVLLGHCGQATNNPYASALDCGACAGHGGGANARAMAAVLNDQAVRSALGIEPDVFFLAGEHNTTNDEVRLFDLQSAPDTHRADIDQLQSSLTAAGRMVRRERAAKLRRSENDLVTGALHWGEVRPEWGLTGNAAFIIGGRELTGSLDLEGRAFLHDYDWRSDPNGDALATILTAPMVVAQWINSQYLFSTIDNERYGAGDKTVHNPVAGIGVVRGNGGDLAVGLPRQSLFHDDGSPAHVPQRLCTIVHAPMARVRTLIEQHNVLRQLFGNGWVRLIVVDPDRGRALRWADDREMAIEEAANGCA